MARQTYDNLRAIIKTKLESIMDNGSPAKTILYEVNDYTEGKSEGYPFANIRISGGEGDFADTARNQREFIFNIDLYQEVDESGKTKEDATDAMVLAIDKIMEAFDTDVRLGESCAFVKVIPVLLDTTVKSGVFLFATFEIHIVDLVNNY
jgi:hypothetical protein